MVAVPAEVVAVVDLEGLEAFVVEDRLGDRVGARDEGAVPVDLSGDAPGGSLGQIRLADWGQIGSIPGQVMIEPLALEEQVPAHPTRNSACLSPRSTQDPNPTQTA